MTKKILRSERDESSLANLLDPSKSVKNFTQPEDYRNKVVLKPWGYEFLIFENENVAIWFLYLRDGHATSMHCHPKKKTSLFLLEGEVGCNFFGHREQLKAFDALNIEKGVFHSTRAGSCDGAFLIEIESPVDKTDLVRLQDEYGRQLTGYEGLSEMRTENIEEFGYFWVNDPAQSLQTAQEHCARNVVFGSVHIKSFEELANFQWQPDWFYGSCRGVLRDSHEQIILSPGDLETGSDLLNHSQPFIMQGELTLLVLRENNP